MTRLEGTRQRVMLLGGLGNQLFQYSFGRYLEGLGAEVRFQAGSSGPPAVSRLLPALDIQEPPMRGLGPIGRFHMVGDTFRRARGWWPKVDLSLQGTSGLAPARRDTVWVGYFQDDAFVSASNVVEEIHLALRAHAPVARTPNQSRKQVCVHVRRGDYLIGTPILTRDYYWHGLEAVVRALALSVEDVDVVVVTDDKAWAEEHCRFPAHALEVQSLGALEDLATIAAADACVLSQSTFSWWGARVRGGRPVAAPTPWRLGADPAGQPVALMSWLAVAASYTDPG